MHGDLPSGRGYVFLTESGSVSAVVSGGSNVGGWESWRNLWEKDKTADDDSVDGILKYAKCLLLQREVPEYANLFIATQAKKRAGIVVFQDVGGEDRPISSDMLDRCDYLIPNETELKRLIQSLGETTEESVDDDDKDEIVRCAKLLQSHGAHNVLVTCGSRGSTP